MILVIVGLTWGLSAVKIDKISELKGEDEAELFYHKARMYGVVATVSGVLIQLALFFTLMKIV